MLVSDLEISALARRLELGDAEFRAMYTRPQRGGDVSLRELRNRDCVFYDPAAPGCRIYEDRPRQCRRWPFWGGVVDSAERWDEEARSCPGMNRGPLHDADTISRRVVADGTSTAKSLG